METKSNEDSIIINNNYLSGDSSFIVDLLRVLACEMVVLSHVFTIYDGYYLLSLNFSNPFDVLENFLGDVGVIIFFIVSGIVISNSLFKSMDSNKSYGFLNYFINRFSRIYSGLIPSLLFIILFDIILISINPDYFIKMSEYSFTVIPFIGNALMLQRLPIINITTPPFAGILWTLNIEWWLYLTFGWIVTKFRSNVKMSLLFFIPLFLFASYPLYLLLNDAYENLVMVWFMGVSITCIFLTEWNKKWEQREKKKKIKMN